MRSVQSVGRIRSRSASAPVPAGVSLHRFAIGAVTPVFPARLPRLPDIVGVDMGAIDRSGDPVFAVTPEGSRIRVGTGDTRRRLVVIDIKHAREAGTGHEFEVAFYGVALSPWLRARGLDGRYLVSSAICLWTSGGIARCTFAAATRDEGATAKIAVTCCSSLLASIRRSSSAPEYLAIRSPRGKWTPLGGMPLRYPAASPKRTFVPRR